MRYDPHSIELKWQKRWQEDGINDVADSISSRQNFYHLVMFPYPSGDLHIGHWYNFGPADIWARWKRMKGFNVLSPMGFDAFGLPAENAAIKNKLHPRDWTSNNIERMRNQLKAMGTMYDWSREVVTSDPSYYRWTQWMFRVMWESGLAERKKVVANWCPNDKTVLANEQVVDGCCERCGAEVEQREIDQWVFRITKYAEPLLTDLDGLDWPERTKIMQRNWIGKSEGAEIEFKIKNEELGIRVFTTRPDTLFGATYMVLAPDHLVIQNLKLQIQNWDEVQAYVQKTGQKTERERLAGAKEKTGVELKGVRAINPANQEEIPVWIADYVLVSYGTGAIMAVPAHDERDFEFAKKFNLPVRIVVCPHYPETTCPVLDEAYEGMGHLVDSGKFDGIASEQAKQKITESVGGVAKVQYRLRDWIISRQRYWGAPIPMIFCKGCRGKGLGERSDMPGWYAVPESELPVILPELDDYLPAGNGKAPLAKAEDWRRTKCPGCGSEAEREIDTMDTFVDSSWYYLRYADPKNAHAFASPDKLKTWLPVNMYIGGAEHTVLHLLYSRFFAKALHDRGYVDFSEPFTSLRHQGIILGEDGQKMSKSRGNVVDPDELVRAYGADAVRMYLAFMGPYDQGGPWNQRGIAGISRFLSRVWNMVHEIASANPAEQAMPGILAETVTKVSRDIEHFRFNTAVAKLMILVNAWEKDRMPFGREHTRMFVKMLSPFAPHFAEELWREALGETGSVHAEVWPLVAVAESPASEAEVVIQVNGRVRDRALLPIGMGQEEAEKIILDRAAVQQWVGDNPVKKFVYVPGKIANVVL